MSNEDDIDCYEDWRDGGLDLSDYMNNEGDSMDDYDSREEREPNGGKSAAVLWRNTSLFAPGDSEDVVGAKGLKHQHMKAQADGTVVCQDISYHRECPSTEEEDEMLQHGLVFCTINQREGEPLLYAVVGEVSIYMREVDMIRSTLNEERICRGIPEDPVWVKAALEWFMLAVGLDLKYGQENVPNDITMSMVQMKDLLDDKLRDHFDVVDEAEEQEGLTLEEALKAGTYLVVAEDISAFTGFAWSSWRFRRNVPFILCMEKLGVQAVFFSGTVGADASPCEVRSVFRCAREKAGRLNGLLVGPLEDVEVFVAHEVMDVLGKCGADYRCAFVGHQKGVHPDFSTLIKARRTLESMFWPALRMYIQIDKQPRPCTGMYLFIDSKSTHDAREKGHLSKRAVEDIGKAVWCTCMGMSCNSDMEDLPQIKEGYNQLIMEKGWNCRIREFHYGEYSCGELTQGLKHGGRNWHGLVLGPLDGSLERDICGRVDEDWAEYTEVAQGREDSTFKDRSEFSPWITDRIS
jgi:hypothetical protein